LDLLYFARLLPHTRSAIPTFVHESPTSAVVLLKTKDPVHAELGEVVAGTKPGRTSSDEVIVFDSTGMALQDVITSALVYEKAKQRGAGTTMELIA
jgi:ornithine cyclodeaminase/alanine dehydrogenase-like protein (mu-crystallin family)